MKDKLDLARGRINKIDGKMAKLFAKRMKAAKSIAEYKKENGLPITDKAREEQILQRCEELISEKEYKEYYRSFQKGVMAISRNYQRKLIDGAADEVGATLLSVDLKDGSYPIIIGRSVLKNADKYFDLNRRAVIVTDSGVPESYVQTVKNLCKDASVVTVPSGECSKSFARLEALLGTMAELGLTREDCVIAVGGGAVGDLAGFAASIYMRGIDFYNVPTTLLAQVDASIGGKTAVNLGSIKNTVGTFKQPKAVVIDVDTLATLPDRHMKNGMCEAVKMAATLDEALFCRLEALEEKEIYGQIEEIIIEALKIKKAIVEDDEKESDKRRVLNFGHTFGHAIEASEGIGTLLHGECVAIGMMPAACGEAKERIRAVLEKLGLPTRYDGDINAACGYISHDKKTVSDGIYAVFTDRIGTYHVKRVTLEDFKDLVKNTFN